MKKYPKTIDSGITWIGRIPEKWSIQKIKFNYKITTGKVIQSKKNNDDEILINFITAGNVFWNNIDLNDLNKMWASKHQIKKLSIQKNDLLICEGGEAGRSAIWTGLKTNCIFQNHIHRLRGKNSFLNKFLMYVMKYYDDIGLLQTIVEKVTLSSLSRQTLGNFQIVLPETDDELEQIVFYLDEKLKKIDDEIVKNQNLIKLMEKKKQLEINQAVTKGLDHTVPMEPSGIELIGKTPKHWKLNKIKFTSYVKGRIGWQGLTTNEYVEKGPYLITGTNFDSGGINWSTCTHVEQWRYDQDPHIQIKNNDILITKDGTIGKIALVNDVPDKTTLNTGVLLLRPLKKNYVPAYMYWILNSNHFLDFIELIKQGSTIQHLYQKTFENFQIILPDTLDEQKEIASYLDEKTKKIDSLISKVELQISNLQKFRKSLISSTVTGKIKVTEP